MAENYIKGEDSILYIKYNNLWCPICCETSSPMSEELDTINTTTRDNEGWETSRATMQRYSLSFNGLAVKEDDADALSYWRLREMKRNRDTIQWRKTYMGGQYIDEGEAIITSIEHTDEVEGFINFSMSLKGFGKPNFFVGAERVLADEGHEPLVTDNNEMIRVI